MPSSIQPKEGVHLLILPAIMHNGWSTCWYRVDLTAGSVLLGSYHQFPDAAAPDSVTTTTACTSTAHRDFDAWCQQMGMLPQAAPGWMSICRQPKACCLLYLASAVIYLASFGVLSLGGVPSPGWERVTGFAIMSLSGLCLMAKMYRHGPAVAKRRLSKCLIAGVLSPVLLNGALSQADRENGVPFGDRSLYVLGACVGVFFLTLAGLSGGLAAAHPAEPHASIRAPIVEAAVRTLRIGNYLTDFGLVAVLLDYVRHLSWIVAGGCGPPRILRPSRCCHQERW